jgi:dTDP-4-dehydrorhamnose 3,5-epimerase
MQVTETKLSGCKVIVPKVFGDSRGYFLETFQSNRYQESGLTKPFVQDNLSLSKKGVLRGLHFQKPNPQGKLVYVLQGEVFDVAVDIRYGSPTFGQWEGVVLSAENHKQFFVPPGFAHGFLVLSDQALFAYKCDDFYQPSGEKTLMWNDPAIGIEWPIATPQLSDKDRLGVRLQDLPREWLVEFK